MWLLLLAACTVPQSNPDHADHVAAIGGPVGDAVPTNAVPWVVFPVDPEAAGTTGARATAGISDRETRAIKLYDAGGNAVAAERVVTQLAGGVRVQVVPAAPLKANADYRLVAPGALMKAFHTGSRPDHAAPDGGEVLAFAWDAGPCTRLVLRHAPVREAGPLFWEIEAVPEGGVARSVRAAGEVAAGTPADLLELRSCEGASLTLPPVPTLVRLRWVDLAGNATGWSAAVRVPAGDAHAAGEPGKALSAAP